MDLNRFNQMHNHFENFSLDNQLNSGAGLVVGTVKNNSAYYNEFEDVFIQITDGIGIEQLDSDGNIFMNVHEFMTRHGKGLRVLFGCDSTSNHFIWISAAYSNRTNGVHVDSP